MVAWFSPLLLLRTWLQSRVAALFGHYADARAGQRAVPPDGPYRYEDHDELWLDYVADLGDGWDATTTVAAALAAPDITVEGELLPHARVLVMGGDEVYPAASREEYLRRLEAPYYGVLPFSPPQAPRDLYALPGNHDWYDGLASFSALFLQQRWFAGWRTRQSRSYFALQLPQRWWFIAADIQLDNDIDAAQRDYLLAATAAMQPGDRVVIACAEPFWLAEGDSIARRNLAWLERVLVTQRGARAWLTLAGDLHHYQRHASDDGAQRIVSGGGGAFLHGTAWQPQDLFDEPTRDASAVASDTGAHTRRWRSQAVFPSPAASRLLALRLLAFPWFNPSFALFLGSLLMLLFWSIDAASSGLLFGNLSLGAAVGPWVVAEAMPASPWLCAGILGWFAAFVAFADLPPAWPPLLRSFSRAAIGTLHALVQLSAGLVVLAAITPSRIDALPDFFAAMFAGALVMSLVAGLLFGLYLFLGYQLLGLHRESAFAACRVADWKHFLRLHIAKDGTLTVHVIGIPRICRRWRERLPAAPGEALVEPADGVALSRRLVKVDTVTIRPA